MRLHATTVLSLSALAVLALTGCSTGSAAPIRPTSPATVWVHPDGVSAPASALLSSAALAKRLLDESDLGEGYTRTSQPSAQHDDVTVVGCPALEKLGSDAAIGSGLAFTCRAKPAFTHTDTSSSEISEELYSDSAAKLSKGVGKVFDAMLSCPNYQVTSGSAVIDMSTARSAAPDLGDERWSQLLTFSVGGQRSVVKQTAIRVGNILVVVSGSPGLVDAHVAKAVAKGLRAR
ncbi:hypothetical protein QF034_004437 [Streptomyces africanus]|uniref:PknH-like extracellular domain-containing protein n=1 Tax=Streptomyces africanus TaxID=231024 RepID=A0ABU0QS50_9ACTN|nr:hypothetical protein [Streptomyces africanus]MDQ0750206.1 hypothetical protein [Streptomyces africanus]